MDPGYRRDHILQVEELGRAQLYPKAEMIVSQMHLPKYLGEFEYRWNMRHVPHLMLDRLLHSFSC